MKQPTPLAELPQQFPFTAQHHAIATFDEYSARAPRMHVTLCEVRQRHTGRLLGYRLFVRQHLMPIPHETANFYTPIRHH